MGDWHGVVLAVHDLFAGLGEIEIREDALSFASRLPDEAASLTLHRGGRLTATMPRHRVEATVTWVVCDGSGQWIEFRGEGLRYLYRLPPEWLERRRAGGGVSLDHRRRLT